MLLVMLVTVAMSTGIAFAMNQYSASMENSQGKVLQSTLKSVITNELETTNHAEYDEESGQGDPARYELVRFSSLNYGEVGAFSEFKVLPSGELALGSGSDSSSWRKLISSSSYPHGLGARISVWCYPDSPAHFHVQLDVVSSSGDLSLTDEFDVIPLNNDVFKPAES